MINTDVDICNMALGFLKQDPISSIEEPESTVEGECSRSYHSCRRFLLRTYPFHFATEQVALPRSSTRTHPFYSDCYRLPADCIRLQVIGTHAVKDYRDKYALQSGFLCVNNEGNPQLNIIYTRDIIDVTQFDPIFVVALARYMAYTMAMALTGKPTMERANEAGYLAAVTQARVVDSQEHPTQIVRRSPWLSRRG